MRKRPQIHDVISEGARHRNKRVRHLAVSGGGGGRLFKLAQIDRQLVRQGVERNQVPLGRVATSGPGRINQLLRWGRSIRRTTTKDHPWECDRLRVAAGTAESALGSRHGDGGPLDALRGRFPLGGFGDTARGGDTVRGQIRQLDYALYADQLLADAPSQIGHSVRRGGHHGAGNVGRNRAVTVAGLDRCRPLMWLLLVVGFALVYCGCAVALLAVGILTALGLTAIDRSLRTEWRRQSLR